jgi:hypothetical protein
MILGITKLNMAIAASRENDTQQRTAQVRLR